MKVKKGDKGNNNIDPFSDADRNKKCCYNHPTYYTHMLQFPSSHVSISGTQKARLPAPFNVFKSPAFTFKFNVPLRTSDNS